jgi:hypothetical protein
MHFHQGQADSYTVILAKNEMLTCVLQSARLGRERIEVRPAGNLYNPEEVCVPSSILYESDVDAIRMRARPEDLKSKKGTM